MGFSRVFLGGFRRFFGVVLGSVRCFIGFVRVFRVGLYLYRFFAFFY